MKDLKGSKTEKNLQAGFAGESQARNKYGYWASVARKEGYEQIAAIFEETAGNEREHAKIWFGLLDGIGDTATNLRHAAEGEHYEWTEMYKGFAEDARAEGFNDVAMLFEMVAKIEKRHDERYQKLAENLKNGLIFARPRGQGLDLSELRSHGQGRKSAACLSGVQTSAGLLRNHFRKLLSFHGFRSTGKGERSLFLFFVLAEKKLHSGLTFTGNCITVNERP